MFGRAARMLEINAEVVVDAVSSFIRRHVKPPIRGAVIGLSGGLDSTVTAYLCVEALGPDRVLALILPDPEVTPKQDVDDALLVAERLGVKHTLIDISSILEAFSSSIPNFRFDAKVPVGNLRARIRMCLLYYYANLEGRLVIGTGDRSELLLGYFTKYGDGGVDILPIGGLYKTQVRRLGEYLGIPESIIKKPSSPRLWRGHLAEEELGLTYDVIDPILHLLVDRKLPPSEVSAELNLPLNYVLRVKSMIEFSEHKRRLPPIAELPPEAFA
ncbi:MAG: NAD(+) synthetase [Candidatus Methanomethylicota archaeon]|nr:MAG: NAD(+) synthetase [Candidatus Verstraetearchaeota archaeon]